jgi:hypothetical protein
MPVAAYREYRPVAELRPYIRCFWHLDRTCVPDEPPEIVWPQLSVEVIFHFGDRYVGPTLSAGPLPHAFTIGPLSRFVPLRSPGRVRLLGARCYPWATCRVSAAAQSAGGRPRCRVRTRRRFRLRGRLPGRPPG